MAKTKKGTLKRSPPKIITIAKTKPRTKEEKFSLNFSNTQLNSILLIILSATFLMQGIVRYFDLIHKVENIKTWFSLALITLIFLVCSIILISLGSILNPLKAKRFFNFLSYMAFVVGFCLFLTSLIYLLVII